MSAGAAHARSSTPNPSFNRATGAETPLRPHFRNQINNAQCLERHHALRLQAAL
jgi:hypothetical protein